MVKSTLYATLLVLLVLQAAHTRDSVVVVTSNNSTRKPILDTISLIQHVKNNQNVINYLVDLTDTQQSAVKIAKTVLSSVGLKSQNVNSFIMQAQQIKNSLESFSPLIKNISPSQLIHELQRNPQSVVYFTKQAKKARLLQQTTQSPSNSQLFANMTPGVLSGLFVGLSLIIVLLISISCLYDLKTNDKYATNQLFVGKQS